MTVYKGWNAKVLTDGAEVGYAESVTVDISTGAEAYWEMGDAKPKEVVAGNIEITGTLDRAWLDTKLVNLITGAPSLTAFTLMVSVTDATTPSMLTVTGCKAETLAFDLPQDGFLTHSMDFIGTDFSLSGPSSPT